MPDQALSDVKVVEYSHFITGPYCTKLLADLGAEVIKIEEPDVGDAARQRGPFPGNLPHPERSGLFLYLNTNKLGVTLDVESPGGKAIFKDLIRDADILVENHPPGVMSDLGLAYGTLREINPRLVVVSITPFGQSGPYRGYRAHDLNLWHMGGMGYITRQVIPGTGFGPPVKPGGRLADFTTGLTSAVAAMCALFSSRMTGRGQWIDVSGLESIASLPHAPVAFPQLEGRIAGQGKSPLYPGGMMSCRDGDILVGFPEEVQWERFFDIMGNPDWTEGDWWKDMQVLIDNAEFLSSQVGEWLKDRSKEEILEEGQARHIPMAALNRAEDVVGDRQFVEREFFVDVTHPETGTVKYPSTGCKFSETPWRIRRPAPLLGEHNEEVLCRHTGVHKKEAHGNAPGRDQAAGPPSGKPAGVESGALDGLRVADFTWAWAGPYATMLLADMGAEVINIETYPKTGNLRMQAPFPGGKRKGVNSGGWWSTVQRGKLSIGIDLKTPRGLELAKGVITVSDLVVENFSPGVMDRLGLGYPVLKELKPDIVYIAMSGYGATGPGRSRVAYGTHVAMSAGLVADTGFPDARPSSILIPYGDPVAGLSGAFAALAALHYRSRTGRGQYIDLSQTEAIACFTPESLMDYTMNGHNRTRNGNRDEVMAPHGCYPCSGKETWVTIAVSGDQEWGALCRAMGEPEWTKQDRFSSELSRWENQDELEMHMTAWTREHNHYDIMVKLQEAGVSAAPTLNGEELIRDPHLTDRGFFVKDTRTGMGGKRMAGPSWKMSDTPGTIRSPAPSLGEHNHYVLSKLLGLSDDAISCLAADGIIESH